jgi:hypothetical protein
MRRQADAALQQHRFNGVPLPFVPRCSKSDRFARSLIDGA